MRKTLKTIHDINKMEDNFALRYVFTYLDTISRAELAPSPRAYARNGAPRGWLGNKGRCYPVQFVSQLVLQ
jgi:hypothetical protein